MLIINFSSTFAITLIPRGTWIFSIKNYSCCWSSVQTEVWQWQCFPPRIKLSACSVIWVFLHYASFIIIIYASQKYLLLHLSESLNCYIYRFIPRESSVEIQFFSLQMKESNIPKHDKLLKPWWEFVHHVHYIFWQLTVSIRVNSWVLLSSCRFYSLNVF